MVQLLELFVARGAAYIREEMRQALSPLAPYLRKLGIGLLLVIMSALAWLGGLIFFLVALFFYFSDISYLLYPAIWTGLISWAVGLLMVIFGLNFLRSPRP